MTLKWLLLQLLFRIIDNFPVLFRAGLYFLASFLMTMADKLGPIFFQDVWPSRPYTIGALLISSGVGCVALRAYYDGSSQRHSDQKNGKGSQTEFLYKSQLTAPGGGATPNAS